MVDLVIIGAGPVGLYGAYYAGCRGLTVAVIDALDEVGGQVAALYPEKAIHDIAGFRSVTGRALVTGLLEQADQFEPSYLLGERADKLVVAEAEDGATTFEVLCSSGRRVVARAMVITAGVGAFKARRLGVGEELEGRGLAYFVKEPAEYENQDVVIVGGGDSALDWALMLEPIARTVTLVHRRNLFRAHASSVSAVRASSVDVVAPGEVVGVEGDDAVEAVMLSGLGVASGAERRPCQRLVAALGFIANLGPMREWPIDFASGRHIVVDSAMQTSLPGVFAAGDITEYNGKVRLISVGFGEVATAVNNAAVFMDPTAALFPGHSTDSDL